MTIQQSFSWDGFARTGIDPEALIKGAAEIGFAGIELVDSNYWPMIRDYGLRIVSTNGHALAPEGINHPGHFVSIEKSILAALEKAIEWGIPYILCFSGNRYGIDQAVAAEIAAQNLSRLAPHFANTDVTLVMELLNSKVPGRDYQADNSAWGVKVCRMVNSPHVRLLYDIFHMQIMEGDLIHTIREHHAYFGHYHTAGNPGRHDLDDDQEIYYPAVFRAIGETGHMGYIGHEFFPKHNALDSLQSAFELCEAALVNPVVK
ncbi:MAG: TIM barrel protein [Anaerolineae bacterium]|nr:TIM barrel protein [Anaerolineae bacterium]